MATAPGGGRNVAEGEARVRAGRKVRRWRLLAVLTVALLCALVAGLVSRAMTPVFSATAQVVVSTGSAGEPPDQRAAAGQTYARTFAAVLDTPALARRALDLTDSPLSAAQLQQRTSLSVVPGTVVVRVAVTTTDPQDAAALATAWAQVAAADGPRLTGIDDARLSVPAAAAVPTSPVRPRPVLYALSAAAVGALLGWLVLAAVAPRRRAEDAGAPDDVADAPRVARLRLLLASRRSWPVAGALAGAAAAAALASPGALSLPGPPAARTTVGAAIGALAGVVLAAAALVVLDRWRGLLVVAEDAAAAADVLVVVETVEPRRRRNGLAGQDLEPYRVLHGTIAARPGVGLLLLVGASAQARAALRAIDLAVAAADAGARTVLVGTSVAGRRRAIAEVLGGDAAAQADLLVPTDRPGLRVLPLGWPAPSDGGGRAALASRRLPLLLDRVRADADLAVVAGPPLADPEVTLRLAGLADGALLVAVAGRWTRSACRAAVDLLQRAGCPVAGILLVRHGWRMPRRADAQVRPQPATGVEAASPEHTVPPAPDWPARERVEVLRAGRSTAADLAHAVRAAGGSGPSTGAEERAVGTPVAAGARRTYPAAEDDG